MAAAAAEPLGFLISWIGDHPCRIEQGGPLPWGTPRRGGAGRLGADWLGARCAQGDADPRIKKDRWGGQLGAHWLSRAASSQCAASAQPERSQSAAGLIFKPYRWGGAIGAGLGTLGWRVGGAFRLSHVLAGIADPGAPWRGVGSGRIRATANARNIKSAPQSGVIPPPRSAPPRSAPLSPPPTHRQRRQQPSQEIKSFDLSKLNRALFRQQEVLSREACGRPSAVAGCRVEIRPTHHHTLYRRPCRLATVGKWKTGEKL